MINALSYAIFRLTLLIPIPIACAEFPFLTEYKLCYEIIKMHSLEGIGITKNSNTYSKECISRILYIVKSAV